MAEYSGFFPSYNGDRRYFTSFFAEYFSDFISNGIYPNPSTQCQVLANNDMTVTLKPGNAYINGYRYKNDSDKSLTIETADGVLKRIDRIVLRYTVLDREIKSYVKKGAFASTPVAPSLQRDADMWELGVADIYVSNGAVSISQANITDLRLNNNYCGIVHGVIDQVDTTTIFNQFQAWYLERTNQATTDIATMLSAFQSSFNAWFANIQDILDENTAGNLLNLINDLIARMTAAETAIENHTADIAALDARLDLKERLLTSTIPTNGWSGTTPYTIAITVPGLTDSRPDINPILSATLATARLEKEAWNTIGYIDCTANTMTVTCLEEIPTTAINVELVGG
ncbi:hypothetical protein [Acetobacterium wieringae]|uniref:Uncharacterized protein n=1 Tax=Acetobacterium wieringae TaxID=52694 RepID=A0A1F2PEU2_9FIRM|nr:hypothetical protein [Acetobacterium wieringae]OFV69392.1 hypothetical protein ACWI_31190 [Acetobacterium wieringae]